jgi:hypothetical protein
MADDRDLRAAGGQPVRQGGASRLSIAAAFALAAALSVGLVIVGSLRQPLGETFIACGCLGLVIVAAMVPLTLVLSEDDAGAAADGRLRSEIAALAGAVSRLSEHGALSDDARRVLNRQRERELLRRAIEEDIQAEDWDAAMVLVKELADRFGYRADAEEFRQRIDQARHQTLDRRVSDAISRLDGLIIQRRWDAAVSEAARISRLFPDSPRADGVRQRVEHARTLYKADLERRFLHAAQEERVEEAMELLKELDLYLGESEAEQFRELARGVIGKARENLGVQFKLAVQDRRWGQAARVGEQIIDAFPNTRMAHEVRGIIDSVRARATAMAS